MSKTPNNSDKKTARQEKLAAALRANLKRRKAAKRTAETAAKKETPNG
jgi:hypothetical protein